MRNNRGITLIALVFTVLVMLILMGASIRFIADDNGVESEARKAKNQIETKMEEQNQWTQNIIDEF